MSQDSREWKNGKSNGPDNSIGSHDCVLEVVFSNILQDIHIFNMRKLICMHIFTSSWNCPSSDYKLEDQVFTETKQGAIAVAEHGLLRWSTKTEKLKIKKN